MAMTETANFEDTPIGSAPKGWTITMTGRGHPQWTVEKDDTAPSQANVLKQSGKATYPLALKDGTTIKDGFIVVKFKAISGSEDRAAGLVWRAVDAICVRRRGAVVPEAGVPQRLGADPIGTAVRHRPGVRA